VTLPAQLTRGHAPGDLLDGRGRLFASIHPGQGDLAALAEAVETRWNAHVALAVRCDNLERMLRAERAARMRAEAERAEAEAALAAALGAAGDLRALIGGAEA